MYAIYKETGLCESFADFKESKHCLSKSKYMTFKFNAGMSRIGGSLKKMCESRNRAS